MSDPALTPQQEDSINVVDPFGKVGSLRRPEALEAMDNGYRIASPDEIKGAKNEDQYGGVQGAIFSATLGAARAATLGGSDVALSALPEGIGFSPDELKGFKETNPKSTLVGEVGGLLRDPLGISKVINSAGKIAETGTKAAIKATGVLEDSSMAAQLLANTMKTGVEGAIFSGAANTIDDFALGDPSLNGEKVLSNIGYGALVGGSVGNLFKLIGFGITPTIRKAADAIAELRNELIGSGYGEKALVNKVLPERISEAITDRQLNLDTRGQASPLKKMAENLNTAVDNIHGEVNNFQSEIEPKALSALFNASSKLASGAQQSVANSVTDLVEKIKAGVPPGPTRDALESLKNKANFSTMIGGSAESIFNSLKRLKGHITDLAEKEPLIAEPLSDLNEGISNALSNHEVFGPAGAASAINDANVSKFREFISDDGKLTPFQELFGTTKNGKWGFDPTKLHEAFSEKDPALRQANHEMLNDFFKHLQDMPENMLNARKAIPNSKWRSTTLGQIIDTSKKTHGEAFEDYLDGINKRRPLYGWKDYAPVLIAKWHPVLAAAIEAYDWYQDPVHATHGLSLVERMIGKTTQKSLDLIDSIFDPEIASKAAIEGKLRLPGKTHEVNDDKNKKDEHKKIRKWANNPDEFADNMENSTKDLSEYAPNISQHLNIATSGAISFLASKAPQSNSQSSLIKKDFEPSSNELAKFERYRVIANDPLESLRQVRDGTISNETVETLNAVYPKLYQSLKESVLEKAYLAKEKGVEIPYRTRQSLSMFLGEPIDSSLAPQAILANQMTIASAPKDQGLQPQQKTRANGLDKMDRSGRATSDYGAMSDKV